MSACFHYPLRVYYEDTDAGGVVYYANYLKFCERARTEWLRTLGIVQQKYLEQNFAFVVSSVTIDYLASAVLDDCLVVTSNIITLKNASLVFEQRIENQNKVKLAVATIKVVHKNLKTQKPCAIPPEILGALKSVC